MAEELLEEYKEKIEIQNKIYIKYKRLDSWIGNAAVGLISIGTYFSTLNKYMIALPSAGAGLIFIKKQCGLAEIASKAKEQRKLYLQAYNKLKRRTMLGELSNTDLVTHFDAFTEINMSDISSISKGSRISILNSSSMPPPIDEVFVGA